MGAWTLGLSVAVDEEERLLRPAVRIGGGLPFGRGAVGVALVDHDGALRGCVTRPLDLRDVGAEVRLPAIAFPDGVRPDEALGWAWDVALAADGTHRVRWRRYLEVGTGVGVDGEIVLAGPPERMRSKAEEEGWGPEAPWDARDSERLLDDLIASGLIVEADRKAVLAESRHSWKTAERVIVERGLLDDRTLLSRIADVTGSELVDLQDRAIDPEAASRVPKDLARTWGCMGIGTRAGMLTVAMSDPQNLIALSRLQDLVGPVYIVLATRDDVLRALDRVGSDR